MEKIVIEASKRDVIGKKVKALRRDGKLPAVVYGKEIDPMPIILDYREARQTLADIGANTLVTLTLDGKELLSLVRDKQFSVIKRVLLHVDFQAVTLTERITTTVPIAIDGEAPAVSEYNGLLVTEMEDLDVEAQAQNLPDAISVDVSGLTEIGDNILVKDLVIADDVKILNHPDEIVIVVAAPTTLEIEIEEEEEIDLFEELEEPELLDEMEEGEEEDESVEETD
jgi:large subunit ribosomal protein L25